MSVTADWPSQYADQELPTAQRRDGRRNRRRLLAAAAELLTRGSPFTLSEAAAIAGLSTATAYRHFRSADDLVEAFVAGFWDDVRERAAREDPPPHSLSRFCRLWVDAVLEWGPGLAYLRSREGFLIRRARGDERVGRLLEVADPRISVERARLGSGRASDDELAYLLALWNALADPRELLDQQESLGWTTARIAEELCGSVRAALIRGGCG